MLSPPEFTTLMTWSRRLMVGLSWSWLLGACVSVTISKKHISKNNQLITDNFEWHPSQGTSTNEYIYPKGLWNIQNYHMMQNTISLPAAPDMFVLLPIISTYCFFFHRFSLRYGDYTMLLHTYSLIQSTSHFHCSSFHIRQALKSMCNFWSSSARYKCAKPELRCAAILVKVQN